MVKIWHKYSLVKNAESQTTLVAIFQVLRVFLVLIWLGPRWWKDDRVVFTWYVVANLKEARPKVFLAMKLANATSSSRRSMQTSFFYAPRHFLAHFWTLPLLLLLPSKPLINMHQSVAKQAAPTAINSPSSVTIISQASLYSANITWRKNRE